MYNCLALMQSIWEQEGQPIKMGSPGSDGFVAPVGVRAARAAT